MNKDEAQGKLDEIKGKVKQSIGDLTDDEELKDEGAADELGGKVQGGFGKARHKVGDAIEDVGKNVKR